ncbi:hypothetical protein G3M48_008843 [Beauveria asiatica]|uniref:Uncharacterized protein n=1 Tax=Beauveria asiatica TaxID=1069075 RepID=A0AAW0RKG0_9HYPO
MDPFLINEQDVTGYFVGLKGDTVALQAERRGQRPQASVRADWLYIPLNDGEWIAELWVRHYTQLPTRITGWENFHALVKKDGIRIDVFSSVQISLNASTWISATG